ncbi:MAG: histone deacetylase family protein [Desulfobacteraceae bacterium]|nr:MAG: histone deacetylase family protein [Desulfobacteraceae bacterium]
MLRIRRIFDSFLPVDRRVVSQVQRILREQFSALSEEDIEKLPEQLSNPFKYRFRSILFVAEGFRGDVKGFAILQHEPFLKFCYLDFLSAARPGIGRGIGSALYERVREESLRMDAIGLFFECLPDDPVLCDRPDLLPENRARLRFYERHGARPIANTAYETPIKPDAVCPPFIMVDDLGRPGLLIRDRVRKVVRAILERKYGDRCPHGYIEMVVGSFKDNPVRTREPRYTHQAAPRQVKPTKSVEKSIALAVNDKHEIHHVHERGYVESPVRVKAILKEIEPTGLFERIPVRHFSERHITAVHDPGYMNYLKLVCSRLEPGISLYPYVFPIRNKARPPKELPIRAGYYCIDTFTPINQNAYIAAKRAVDCALTVAEKILEGYRLGYALVRPPGHHAEQRAFGGFCYFNSTAVAAHYLSGYGRVAILDIDYHHGNGTQDIFYKRSDVLTMSIHGHPQVAYPYFSGFEDEKGEGEGKGYNINMPLPEHATPERYKEAVAKAIGRIAREKVHFLVLALGLDTARGDPTGSWALGPGDFRDCGRLVGGLRRPTVVIQEGGYRIRSLGVNARNFFEGLMEGSDTALISSMNIRRRTKKADTGEKALR